MTLERFAPDDPREWLNRAKSNLARARSRVPDAYLEDLCFDAQQAAEKAIKAVLVQRRIEFPYIHDCFRLLKLLEDAGELIREDLKEVGRLNRYAVATRYPLVGDPVTEEDYECAVTIAETVVRWAEARLAAVGSST